MHYASGRRRGLTVHYASGRARRPGPRQRDEFDMRDQIRLSTYFGDGRVRRRQIGVGKVATLFNPSSPCSFEVLIVKLSFFRVVFDGRAHVCDRLVERQIRERGHGEMPFDDFVGCFAANAYLTKVVGVQEHGDLLRLAACKFLQ